MEKILVEEILIPPIKENDNLFSLLPEEIKKQLLSILTMEGLEVCSMSNQESYSLYLIAFRGSDELIEFEVPWAKHSPEKILREIIYFTQKEREYGQLIFQLNNKYLFLFYKNGKWNVEIEKRPEAFMMASTGIYVVDNYDI